MNKRKLTSVILTLGLVTSLLPMAALGLTKDTVSENGIDITQKTVFQVGSKTMLNEDSEVTMDIEPYLERDRTYVPVRYFGEALGGTVDWDVKTKHIIITLPNKTKVDVTEEVVLQNNRSFLAINTMRDRLGVTIDWIEGEKLVVIHNDTLTYDFSGKTVIWWKSIKKYDRKDNEVIDLGGGIGSGGGIHIENTSKYIPGTGDKF